MRRVRDDGESDAARQRREESQRCLERGELPLNAVERLRAATAGQGTAFTSDLSANEVALLRQAGGEALGQVLGSSVYFIGVQWRTPNWRDSDRGRAFGYELDVVTQGFANARQLALGRLRQEAALLGATGVVGVRLDRTRFAEAESLFEFTAIGTAIRDLTLPRIPNTHHPSLSHLSGQEYWLLRQAGYRPAGLVIGNCAYYQIPSRQTFQVLSLPSGAGAQNREIAEYSEALSQARTHAMERLAAEARALGAEGVVGVRVDIEAQPGPAQDGSGSLTGMLCHFTAIGTAIARDPAGVAPAKPGMAIWLR